MHHLMAHNWARPGIRWSKYVHQKWSRSGSRMSQSGLPLVPCLIPLMQPEGIFFALVYAFALLRTIAFDKSLFLEFIESGIDTAATCIRESASLRILTVILAFFS